MICKPDNESSIEVGLVKYVLNQSQLKVKTLFEVRDRPGVSIMNVGFTPARKRRTHVYRIEQGVKVCVFVKGASEIILSRCTKMIGNGGTIKDIDENARSNARKVIDDFAHEAMRTICIAYKEFSKDEWERFSA